MSSCRPKVSADNPDKILLFTKFSSIRRYTLNLGLSLLQQTSMDFIKFISSRTFAINVVLGLLFLGASVYGALKYLDVYSRHGESITVPDFIGYKVEELDEVLAGSDLQYVIVDSIYDFKKPKGAVVDQKPRANSQVKHNRKVYLTVNAMKSAMVHIPNITDVSLRQAIAIIESYGLKVGKLIHKPDPCLNCVIGVQMRGRNLRSGSSVAKGSTIDLVLGQGESDEVIPVPVLSNMRRKEAEDYLNLQGLNVGAQVFEGCVTTKDSSRARVYKQIPPFGSNQLINIGRAIDLFYTLDTLSTARLVPDTIQMNGIDTSAVNE